MQNCNNCHEEKALSKFQCRGNRYEKQCNDCVNSKRRANRLEKKKNPVKVVPKYDDTDIPNGSRRCTKCNEIKTNDKFKQRNGKPISHCKLCTNKETAKWKSAKRAKIKEMKIEKGDIILAKDPDNNKVCPYCETEKSNDNFRHNRQKCLDCERKDGRNYRRNDHGKKKAQIWTKNNKQHMKELQSDWYQNHKSEINEKFRNRYKSDFIFKLRSQLKATVSCKLRSHGSKKIEHTIEYIGCSIEFLMSWLEYCFDDSMTFENHGPYWHIDHVIPINKWNLKNPEHIKNCFHWTNLTPMKGVDNMTKKDNILTHQIIHHMNNLLNFMTFETDTNNDIDNNIKQAISFYKERYDIFAIQYIRLCARHLKMPGTPLEL